MSYTLEKDLPKEWQYNPWVDKGNYGTVVHGIAEAAVSAQKKMTVAQIKKMISTYKLTDEEADRALQAVAVYDGYIRKLAKRKDYSLKVEVKDRCFIDELECVAKADALLVGPGVLHVCDLKTGAFDYSETAQKQLLFGGLVHIVANNLKGMYEIHGHIIQPAYYNPPQRVVALGCLWSGDINGARDCLMQMALQVQTQIIHQGDHCSFCRALPKCPKQTALALSFESDTAPAVEMSIDRLDYIVRNKKRIEQFLEACESQVKTLLESGAQFPTLGFVTGSGRRRWKDEFAVKSLFYVSHGGEIFEPLKLKSPAQLEKIVGKKNIEEFVETPTTVKIGVVKNPFEALE